MRHWIKYKITEEAQQAAARAGLPAAREQEIELPQELVGRALDLGASIGEDGEVTLNCPTDLSLRPDSPAAALYDIEAAVAQATARQRENLEREVAEILAQEPARGAREYVASTGGLSPETVAALGVWEGKMLAAEGAWDAANEAAVAAYEAGGEYPTLIQVPEELYDRRDAEQARRQNVAKRARLSRLAELAHGCLGVVERIDAGPGPLGLLPEAEAEAMVRDAALPVGEGLAEYRPLRSENVWKFCDCSTEYSEHAGEVSFLASSPEDAGGLTAAEWETAKGIRVALAAADLPAGEIRLHRGGCSDTRCPAWPVRRVGVKVELNLGDGVVVEREYGEVSE